MNIDVAKQSGGIAVVTLAGRLDLVSAANAKQAFASTVTEGHRNLVVDLGHVSFVDSSGLGALIGGLKAARQSGGDLRLANPSEQVNLILKLTTLDRVLATYSSLEEALAAW